MPLEYKSFAGPVELRTLPGGGATLTGLASSFGNIDSFGDTVLPGAYADSIRRSGGKYPLLMSHDTGRPIGLVERSEERPDGLWITARLLTHQTAREALENIQAGIMRGLSIGFQIQDWQPTSAGRLLKQIALKEISTVIFPADSYAQIISVESDDERRARQVGELSRWFAFERTRDDLERNLKLVRSEIALRELASKTGVTWPVTPTNKTRRAISTRRSA